MSEGPLYCANHPHRETNLRCNRCGKPICPACAVLTPVGYRCKECIREQRAVFETARWFDFIIVGVVVAIGVGLSMFLLGFIGIWGLLLAPLLGGGIVEIVHRAVGKRRSRRFPTSVIIGGIVGALPHFWPVILGLMFSTGGLDVGLLTQGFLIGLLPFAYAFLLIGTILASMRGIRG